MKTAEVRSFERFLCEKDNFVFNYLIYLEPVESFRIVLTEVDVANQGRRCLTCHWASLSHKPSVCEYIERLRTTYVQYSCLLYMFRPCAIEALLETIKAISLYAAISHSRISARTGTTRRWRHQWRHCCRHCCWRRIITHQSDCRWIVRTTDEIVPVISCQPFPAVTRAVTRTICVWTNATRIKVSKEDISYVQGMEPGWG